MSFWSFLFITCMVVQHVSGGARSCKQLRDELGVTQDGVYHLRTTFGMEYQTYCDMTSVGGGWTLVASVHENNMHGKCTVGDRWTTQQGNSPKMHSGDLNWVNYRSFGSALAATSDDFKSPGYYDITAEDVQVWHVPNIAECSTWREKAILRYHTANHFLAEKENGGNLFNLFAEYPMKQGVLTCQNDQGPNIPVIYDYGNNATVRSFYGPYADEESHPGWIQFRTVNNERAAFAMCSGVRACGCNVEHFCIGGGGYVPEKHPKQCGDFTALDYDGYGTNIGWSANKQYIEASVLIFYR